MILIDDRIGSKELAPLFPADIPSTVLRLDAADIAFPGNGPYGPVMVGIERKRISDLIQSMQGCRLSGRQIPEMLKHYQYMYLFVEGIYREGPDGQVQVRRGEWWADSRPSCNYEGLEGYLTSLENLARVRVRKLASPKQTVSTACQLWAWYQKEWTDHNSLNQFNPSPEGDFLLLTPGQEPSLVARVAKELPGIGWKRAGKVGEKWRTVMDMVCAERRDWEEVEGVGRVLARRVWESLRGKEK